MNKEYFDKELFHYDLGENVYVCPGGARLFPRYEGKVRDNRKIEYCDRAACLKPRCMGNSYHRGSRLENEAILDRIAVRLDTLPDLLDQRCKSAEYSFGTIKQLMNQGVFLMRGLDNVRGDFSLVYNFKRAVTNFGVQGLITAAKA